MTYFFGARGLLFRLLNRLVRLLDPNMGSCNRCHGSWTIVHKHSTFYQSGRVCTALCEHCWTELGTPEARLPYYRALFDLWVLQNPRRQRHDFNDIADAVRDGG